MRTPLYKRLLLAGAAVVLICADIVGFFALSGWMIDWSNSKPVPSGAAQGTMIALWFISLAVSFFVVVFSGAVIKMVVEDS